MVNLAYVYSLEGNDRQADSLYREALEAQRRVLGTDHPDTLATLSNLALSYSLQEDLAEAEPMFLEALDAEQRVLGPEHPETLITMNDLALMYKNHGQTEKPNRCTTRSSQDGAASSATSIPIRSAA